MGVMNLIRQQKQSFRKLQTDRSVAHNVAAANELQALKDKRIRAEGKANLSKLQQQERTRLGAANQTVRDNSKGMRLAKNMANFMNEGKSRLNQMKTKSSGPGFNSGVSNSNTFGGGSGFNVGGGSNPFSGPAHKEKSKLVKVVTKTYNK